MRQKFLPPDDFFEPGVKKGSPVEINNQQGKASKKCIIPIPKDPVYNSFYAFVRIL